MIRTKGEPGTGNVVEAVRHMRMVTGELRRLLSLPEEEVPGFAKEIGAPLELLHIVREKGALPVVNFAAGGISTPADAALMMQLGCDGIFVGLGHFQVVGSGALCQGHCDRHHQLQRSGRACGSVGRARRGHARP